MKHTIVLVWSHSKNPQSCVPTGESGFAAFPRESQCILESAGHDFLEVARNR